MKFLSMLLAALILSGCVSTPSRTPPPAFGAPVFSQMSGQPIFSIRMTQDAFDGPTDKVFGHFLYIDDSEHHAVHPTVTFYEVRNGKITDVVGGGSGESEQFLNRLRSIGLESFDFNAEIDETNIRESKKAAMDGTRFIGPLVMDGAEHEITYSFDGASLSILAWNPGYSIDFYAKYSPKIAKLKAVLDLVSEFYGRGRIGI